MQQELDNLAKLTQKITNEKRIDQALDGFISGAQLVKKILAELEQVTGKVYQVIDDVEKIMGEESC